MNVRVTLYIFTFIITLSHIWIALDLSCLFSHVLAPQTELSDGIAMMVGNNDRMQGIISQLEEACRVIEVSVQLLQRLAAHSHSKPHPIYKPMHLRSPAQTYKETCPVSLSLPLLLRSEGDKCFDVPDFLLHALSRVLSYTSGSLTWRTSSIINGGEQKGFLWFTYDSWT